MPIHYVANRMGGFVYLYETLVDGADGFRLMYFHLISRGINVVLVLTVFLIGVWEVFVGCMVEA